MRLAPLRLAAAIEQSATADQLIRPAVARARALREQAFIVRLTARVVRAHNQRSRAAARESRAQLAERRHRDVG